MKQGSVQLFTKGTKLIIHSEFEEADICALEAGHNVGVVISNDTDVNTNCSPAFS